MCQFKHIHEMAENPSPYAILIGSVTKTLSKIKKNISFLQSRLATTGVKKNHPLIDGRDIQLNPGDVVKVRSRIEIEGMLDYRGTYKKCSFVATMYSHCDKNYKVLNTVSYFYDEKKGELCKCQDLVVLEGIVCSGKQKLLSVNCDLLCFLFWHKNWLEKVETS